MSDNKAATTMADLLREVAADEIGRRVDVTTPCYIDSVEADGTVSVVDVADPNGAPHTGVLNPTVFVFKKGDRAFVTRIMGRWNSAFVATPMGQSNVSNYLVRSINGNVKASYSLGGNGTASVSLVDSSSGKPVVVSSVTVNNVAYSVNAGAANSAIYDGVGNEISKHYVPYGTYLGTLDANSSAFGADSSVGAAGASVTKAYAIGNGAHASGNGSVAVGWGNAFDGDVFIGDVYGTAPASGAAIHNTIAIGNSLWAYGNNCVYIAPAGLTLYGGLVPMYDNAVAIGANLAALGANYVIIGAGSTTQGNDSVTIGSHADALVDDSVGVGAYSYAYGYNATAIGYNAHAGHLDGFASGNWATAVGYNACANTHYASAFGAQSYAVSLYSSAFGVNTVASGNAAIAIGPNAAASGESAIAVGNGSTAAADFVAIAIGSNARANASRAIAIGNASYAGDDGALAFGYNSNARAYRATAVGCGSCALGQRSVSVGDGLAANYGAVSLGYGAYARNQISVALGCGSMGYADCAIAVGYNAYASAENATAIGYGANATELNAIALGTCAAAAGASSLAFGTGAQTSNVASSGVAIGPAANVGGVESLGVGHSAEADSSYATVVGGGAHAYDSLSTVVGYGAHGYNAGAVALGASSSATGNYAIAVGTSAKVVGDNASAFGQSASATSLYGVAVGYSAVASGANGAVALGAKAAASAPSAIAIGNAATGTDNDTVAIGNNASCVRSYGVAIGTNARAARIGTVVIGHNASAGEGGAVYYGSVSIGDYARAQGAISVAIGAQSGTFNGEESVAIGNGAFTDGGGSVALGGMAKTSSDELSAKAVALGWYSNAFGIDSLALGALSSVVVSNWVSFDPTTYNRTVALANTDSIFFRNQNVNTSYYYQSNYESGKTLTAYLNGSSSLSDGSTVATQSWVSAQNYINGVYVNAAGASDVPIVGASPIGSATPSSFYANASATVNAATGAISAPAASLQTLNVSGSAVIYNLVTQGNSTIVNSVSLNVADQLITVADGNAAPLTSPAGLVVPNYDGQGNYGALVYDKDGYAYVGDAVIENNTINAAASDLQKLAARANALTPGYVSVWNGAAQHYEDGIALGNVMNSANTAQVPTQEAAQSYSITTDIEANQTDSAIPTAAAVANYAASARHFSIALSPDGTYNTTGAFANATYLSGTGVGYVSGAFSAASAIPRGSMRAVSAPADLTAWLGGVTGEFPGTAYDSTLRNDMSVRLSVANGVATLYASAVPAGDSVRFKVYW